MKTVIWPAYIDSGRTKKEGRKISKNLALKTPKLREISRAAGKLGLNPQVENDKSYPKSWWESSGRVIVDKDQSKIEILKKISKTIKGYRN